MKVNSAFKFKPYLIAIVLLEFLIAIIKSAPVLFEDDILIEQDAGLENRLSNRQSDVIRRTKRAAVRKYIWDFGVIPYVIDETVGYSDGEKARFKQAMQQWEKFTCIKFVERNENEHDYFIRFTKTEDCACCSHVGQKPWSSRYSGQDVNIGDGCHVMGVILHELGHAIGYWHEHQRPDRDDYVEIRDEYTSDISNFNKFTTYVVDSLGEAYDYDSIMHYSDKFLLPKNRDKNGQVPRIGQLGRLSPGDIRQTNKLYKCSECGSTFHEKSATIISPSYFTKSGQANRCEWRISVAKGRRIRLDIFDLDIIDSIDCQNNYLEIRDGYWHKSPLLGRFCGVNITIPTILSTGNRMIINFVTEKSNHRGFAASYTSYVSHSTI